MAFFRGVFSNIFIISLIGPLLSTYMSIIFQMERSSGEMDFSAMETEHNGTKGASSPASEKVQHHQRFKKKVWRQRIARRGKAAKINIDPFTGITDEGG